MSLGEDVQGPVKGILDNWTAHGWGNADQQVVKLTNICHLRERAVGLGIRQIGDLTSGRDSRIQRISHSYYLCAFQPVTCGNVPHDGEIATANRSHH